MRARLIARRTHGTGDYELELEFTQSRVAAALRLEEPVAAVWSTGLISRDSVRCRWSLEGPRTAEKLQFRDRAGPASPRGARDDTHGSRQVP